MSSTCIMHPGPSFKQLQRWQGIRAENRAKRLGCAHEGCLTSNSYACQNLQYSHLIQPLYLIADKALWPIGALLSAFFTYLVCSLFLGMRYGKLAPSYRCHLRSTSRVFTNSIDFSVTYCLTARPASVTWSMSFTWCRPSTS